MPGTVTVSGSFGQTLEQHGISVSLSPITPNGDDSVCRTGDPDFDVPRHVVMYDVRATWPDSMRLSYPDVKVGKQAWYAYTFSDPSPYTRGITYQMWTCNQDDDSGTVQLEWGIDAAKPPYYFRFVFN